MSKIRTLSDACSEIIDCAHKTAPVDESGAYFAVGTPAMRSNVIDYSEARRISRETFEKWTTRLRPQYGDLLLAREAPVGPVVRIPPTENVAPGQRTVLLRPSKGVVEPRFLYYYLISPGVQSDLLVKASGSTVPHLNVADVRIFPTPGIPRLSEQAAIAAVLGALDDKITANDRVINLADELCAAEVDRATRKSQVVALLRDILTLHYGKALPASRRVAGQVSVFGSGGHAGWHDSALVPTPGIVVGRKGTVGAIYWADGPHFPIDTTYFVEPVGEFSSEVLFYLLKKLPLSELNSDSAVPGLNRNEAYSQRIRVPSLEFKAELSDRFSERFKWMTSVRAETRVLAQTRDELLPLLMSGKLRVKDAEKVVEEVT